jgi:hypothetical protein
MVSVSTVTLQESYFSSILNEFSEMRARRAFVK